MRRELSKWRKYKKRRNIVTLSFYGSYILVTGASRNLVLCMILELYFPLVSIVGFVVWRICPIEVLARMPRRRWWVFWSRSYGHRRWWALLLYGGYAVVLLLTLIVR